MQIQKETYREFEFQKLIFETSPDANKNQASPKIEATKESGPGLDQVQDFLDTLENARKEADVRANETKKEGVKAVIRAATNPEDNRSIDEGAEVQGVTIEDILKMTPGIPDKIKEQYRAMATPENTEPQPTTETGPATMEKPKASPDKVAEGLYGDKDTRILILNFIAPGKDASKIDQAKFTELVKAHADFSKVLDSVTTDEKGELNLDQKGREAFATAIDKAMGTEGMKRPNQAEMKLIGEVKLAGKKTLSDIYGPEVVQMLSMQYETRIKEKGAPLEVKIKDEKWVAVNAETIGILLPSDIATAHEKRSDKTSEDAYKKLVGTKLEGLQKAMALRDAISGKEAKEGSVNLLAQIKSYMLILKMITEGMKNGGDFGDFGDAIADAQSGKDIIKNRDAATQEYQRQIAPIDDIGVLLALHNNPHAGKAAQMFGEGEGATRYRKQLEVAVKQKLAPGFGPGTVIESIKDQNGTSGVKINQGGENYYAEITPGSTFNTVKLMKVEMVNGQETFGKPVEGKITDLKAVGENSLEGMVAIAKKGVSSTPEPSTVPENTPPAPAVTPAPDAAKNQPTPPEKKPETPAPAI